MRFVLPFSLILMLAACGGQATDPSGITPGEAQALNDAAEMLESNTAAVPSETQEVQSAAEKP